MRRGTGLALLLLVACAGEPLRLVSLTAPEDTRDTVGPYVVQAELRGDLDDDELIVCWSTDGEHFVREVARGRDGRSDLRFATLPGQPAGTTVSFLVALVEGGGACPAVDASTTLRSFRVLADTLVCEVDSDCRLGVEVCAGSTCREYSGTCQGGAPCPGGTACDETRDPPTCVVPPRTCTGDEACPPLEQCDLERGECVARP